MTTAPAMPPCRPLTRPLARLPYRRRAFTLFELLIAVAVIGLILATVVPYVMNVREIARRAECVKNLQVIRDALNAYVTDHHGYPRVRYDSAKNPDGWTAYTGADAADPFAPASAVRANDVTASLWLLVREGYVSDTAVFVCPSSGDWPDRLFDAKGDIVPAKRRGNFRSAKNLSYSFFCPFSSAPGFQWTDTFKPECALLADKSPGVGGGRDVTKPNSAAAPEAYAVANSLNHGRAGQNVLYADNTVRFERSPYCGYGYAPAKLDERTGQRSAAQPGDNIYTALRATPIPPGENPPGDGRGVFGTNVGPAWLYDSYLVPAAE